ncbi:hypothetical protein DYB34_009517 [Aphanomyces astaci]|uniref:AMP-dependent synthetase/ligase domain-containing protein n=3 Tax=Aphanomyces astaci TaxID=112090 RepID=A0A3R6ZFF0_APHAT|nr:hypothetical protein DYB34_009517 [Aphanomyces astaci]
MLLRCRHQVLSVRGFASAAKTTPPSHQQRIYKSAYPPIPATPVTTWQLVQQAAKIFADAPALICGISHKHVTYCEFEDTVLQVATSLSERGVAKGDASLYLAKFVVTHDSVENAATDAAKSESIPTDRIFSVGSSPSGIQSFRHGVRLSFWNLAVNALQWQTIDKFTSPALAMLPYNHIYGTTLMNGVLLSGQPQVILPKFDPVTFLQALQQYKSSSGNLVPNTELRVVCPSSGADLPPHALGELWYRGPQVMLGYLNNHSATEATMTSCGFMKTGDLGYIDDDGHVYVVDRLKELIKYKGHQLVFEDLMAYVAASVAPFKKVRQVEFVDAIPKSPSGKILRRELQAAHE